MVLQNQEPHFWDLGAYFLDEAAQVDRYIRVQIHGRKM